MTDYVMRNYTGCQFSSSLHGSTVSVSFFPLYQGSRQDRKVCFPSEWEPKRHPFFSPLLLVYGRGAGYFSRYIVAVLDSS